MNIATLAAMATSSAAASSRKRKSGKRQKGPVRATGGGSASGVVLSLLAMAAGALLVYGGLRMHTNYAISLQSPLRVRLQWPVVIARRADTQDAEMAQSDQKHPLTAYQQYACRKFGKACRTALAIQRAENPQGKCEIYHYNTDGTLDWGYFQINTVHLRRPGLVLRDLLDCKANIDFAFQLYEEQHGFTAWSTFNSGLTGNI